MDLLDIIAPEQMPANQKRKKYRASKGFKTKKITAQEMAFQALRVNVRAKMANWPIHWTVSGVH